MSVVSYRRDGTCSDVVVAAPTYRAAYTGLLKAFLDRYPSNGLSVTAFAVMTGASATHSMVIDATYHC